MSVWSIYRTSYPSTDTATNYHCHISTSCKSKINVKYLSHNKEIDVYYNDIDHNHSLELINNKFCKSTVDTIIKRDFNRKPQFIQKKIMERYNISMKTKSISIYLQRLKRKNSDSHNFNILDLTGFCNVNCFQSGDVDRLFATNFVINNKKNKYSVYYL